MRTLTKMLLNSYMPMNKEQRESARGQVKEWLKQVALPNYQSYGKGGVPISATESIRKLLITLADEP